MDNLYRAAVFAGPRAVTFTTQPVVDPSLRQVRVRMEGCGVCGSNLPVWEGRPWFKYPLEAGAPGHEGWGHIEALGAEVNGGLRIGQRVAVLSYHAFAEVDLADASTVVPLPDALRDQPFPGEALGCAMNVFRRADIHGGQTVAVIGIGFLGAILTNLAARAGARVMAFSRRPSALEVARKMGATHLIPLADNRDVVAAGQQITGGGGCARVIEATGLQEPLDLAGELTAERGKLIIAGYHQDGARRVNMQLWNWRGLDVINAHERDPLQYVAGMREAVAAVASGRLYPRPLYTHRFKLGELGDALQHLHARDPSFLKALVTYA